MFSFKKSKGRRNIRKKDTGADEGAADSEATDIVKRSTKPKPDVVATGSPRPSLQIKEHVVERAEDTNTREYTASELQALKEESTAPESNPVSDTAYPFSSEGIPNAQEIHMAKKLRRQRQAAQRMDEDDSTNEEDFIRLSDGMESSRIDDGELENAADSIAEGEDELDAVIVDKNERAEFGRIAKQAMEESIERAHDDDEMSDWENEQLRKAGVSVPPHPASRQPQLPKDNGFEFDMEQFKFMVAQEKNQLAIEQDRLKTAQDKLAASSYALSELHKSIEQAQKQYDHFSSLAKSTS